MKTSDLDYYLPSELIAQNPSERRGGSRLLVLDRGSGAISDRRFADIESLICSGDCLVLNDTKVLAARFFCRRQTGAAMEGLYLSSTPAGYWRVLLKNARRVKIGEQISINNHQNQEYIKAQLIDKCEDGSFLIALEGYGKPEDVLERIGYAPLPPYIKREKGGQMPHLDRERYQTVFASQSGAVAAPTAGLHFTDEMLERLRNKGISFATVTLHVGAGTFKPVTSETLEEHKIHSERYRLTDENASVINRAKQNGGRIIAVGTTSVRTLETVAEQKGEIKAAGGDTRLFITPGFQYKAVDAMITNFHLPKSTLLALVGAFAGMDNIFNAYRHAVEQRYRFFSYGDAMFIA